MKDKRDEEKLEKQKEKKDSVATYRSTEVRKGQNNGPRRSSPREKPSGVATIFYLRKTL